MSHGHSLDATNLSQALSLVIESLSHVQGIDNINFSLAIGLLRALFDEYLPKITAAAGQPGITYKENYPVAAAESAAGKIEVISKRPKIILN